MIPGHSLGDISRVDMTVLGIVCTRGAGRAKDVLKASTNGCMCHTQKMGRPGNEGEEQF